MSELEKPLNPEPTPPVSQYEFTEEQNQTILVVGSGFWLLGLVLIVLGIKRLVRCFTAVLYLTAEYGKPATWSDAIDYAMLGFLLLSFGVPFLKAAHSFRAVVETKGNDIAHLMNALGSVARVFSVIIVVACVILVISLVMFVLTLIGVL